jgi:hypothetical protein
MTIEATIPHVLRLFDPIKQSWLLTPSEMAAQIVRLQEEVARLRQGDGQ